MSLLGELNKLGALRTLDDALAQSLRRLDPDASDGVLAGAALASLAVANGHAAVELGRPQVLVDAVLAWPAREVWQQQLLGSAFVATPEVLETEAKAAPLVLEHGLLYLRRYREYERRLALRLQKIAAQQLTGDDPALAPLFAQLFASDADALQARAASLSLRRNLLLVTGGPGTGKTTTIARLLALRIAQCKQAGKPPPKIALAAPTGRAAERMAESLQRATQALASAGIAAEVLAALPSKASTLHRLLGVIPTAVQFKHHADNPLDFDIVVVDEASMVDLPLMCKLTEAVADDAQLILLGDPDQLPSVEAGDVLAAILQAEQDAQKSLHGSRVHLLRGWRQSDALQLAPLAEAMRCGAGEQALVLLHSGELGNVHFHPAAHDPLLAYPALLEHWRGLATLTDPAQALQQAGRLRLLTALRVGPQGTHALNARIEAQLCGQRAGAAPDWFAGKLLLITENSPRHGLFNGDVGICLRDAQGVPLVWFWAEDGIRSLHPAALPAHESAFAMTVHKAQGSEFETVFLQLPARDSQVLSRELLYTGITRARSALHLAGSAEVIASALSRHAQRVSGLAMRL